METNASDGNIVFFTTRSQKLATDLMSILGMRQNIIDSFRNGIILRTNCVNIITILQEGVTEGDQSIIEDLERNGLMVFHILVSQEMDGLVNDDSSDSSIGTFEDIVTVRYYLCVPTDIVAEAQIENEDGVSQRRKVLVENFIQNALFMAAQGYLYAYIVNEAKDTTDFANIEVTMVNGNLVKRN